MATEGQFPKIDGDVLYASEANSFRGAGRYLAAGSTITLTVSGTDAQILGSVVIPANTIPNFSMLVIDYFTKGTDGGTCGAGVTISGASANARWSLPHANATDVTGNIRCLVGNTLSGGGVGYFFNGAVAYSYGQGQALTNLDITAPIVLLFDINIGNGSYYGQYLATCEGRGY